jgi:hypothetical protein
LVSVDRFSGIVLRPPLAAAVALEPLQLGQRRGLLARRPQRLGQPVVRFGQALLPIKSFSVVCLGGREVTGLLPDCRQLQQGIDAVRSFLQDLQQKRLGLGRPIIGEQGPRLIDRRHVSVLRSLECL